ncbi:MAG: phage adaptor protein, partial [Armatimonadota bacterium]
MANLNITGTTLSAPAWESTRGGLRTRVRREVRDEAASVFTNTELNVYIENAIREYSRYVPREVKSTLSLVANQGDYSLPENCSEVVEVDGYSVAEVFGNLMTLSPVPAASATAIVKYGASIPCPR